MKQGWPIAVAMVTIGGLLACVSEDRGTDLESSLSLITAEQLQAHVEFLSADALAGRRSGDAGYDAAAAYVAEQLTAMGVVAHGESGWYQHVALRRFKLEPGSARFTIHRDGEDVDLVYRDDFAMGADELRPTTSVRAEVAYVGFGVHAPEYGYSDYDGIDVDGKIVAFFSGAPEGVDGDAKFHYRSVRTKAHEAAQRGAVGTIVLRSRTTEEQKPLEKRKNRFGRRASTTWISDDGRAGGYYPELISNGSLSLTAAEALFGASPLSFDDAHEASLSSTPRSALLNAEVTMSTASEHSTKKSANVVGLVPGTDESLRNEYVVYTAHLDHLGVRAEGEETESTYNGMYDNAMGVALMLETARVIAAAPAKRSVLFVALTAEESGLLGSDYFVHNRASQLDSFVANINLDMPLFLYPLADVVAFGSQRTSLQAVAESAAAAEGFMLSDDPLPEENLLLRSDQYSFVRQGIPAVFLVSGFTSSDNTVDGEALFRDHLKNHYHKPSDDMSRPVHWPSAVRFARTNARIGHNIATNERRPAWNDGDFYGTLRPSAP